MDLLFKDEREAMERELFGDTALSQREKLRLSINLDVESFLASGGEIKDLGSYGHFDRKQSDMKYSWGNNDFRGVEKCQN